VDEALTAALRSSGASARCGSRAARGGCDESDDRFGPLLEEVRVPTLPPPISHPRRATVRMFLEAQAEIAGVERKIHFFAIDLPHSDACFVQAHASPSRMGASGSSEACSATGGAG